jgi:GR25 family glycosyltransferase involved in LPS biosynthesis
MSHNHKIILNDIDFYFINLDKRTDRLSHITNELLKINLNATKFKAIESVDGYNMNFGSQFSEGQKKCYLSHYSLIKNYNLNSDKILGIFEDDVIFCEDFLDRFKYIEDFFDLDWDIFYLSSFYHLNNDKKRWHTDGDFEKTGIKYIHRVYGSFCCHSYLINPKSIPKIIKLLDDVVDQSYAIDHALILIQPKLNCYAFTPGMTTQLTNPSDTDGGIRDQTHFKEILGEHYYTNKLSEFNYDEYFKN